MNHETAKDALAMWKHARLMEYATAFLQAGFAEHNRGRNYFGSDNIPEDALTLAGEDRQSIPGSAVAMLRHAGCIKDFWATVPLEGIHGGRRRSLRASRNAAKCQLYSLAVPVAREWLSRNGVEVETAQMEMAI